MTRVSLKEAYDNKDIVAQIYAIRDTAESAVDTSEQAVTTANTASEHVDALVPQVEQAVENANSASASAQASAQTVAGYENRLGTVETGLSTAQHDITAVEDNVEDLSGDLNAVTLRVQTAEGDIVTIQGRVTALETADGQNVKLTGSNAIGNYAVLLTGSQDVDGFKTLLNRLFIRVSDYPLIDCLLKDFVQGDTPATFLFGGSRVWASPTPGENTFLGHNIIGVTSAGYCFAEIKLEGNHGNKEATLNIREKEDGNYSLSFFNGTSTTTLVP